MFSKKLKILLLSEIKKFAWINIFNKEKIVILFILSLSLWNLSFFILFINVFNIFYELITLNLSIKVSCLAIFSKLLIKHW